MIIQKHRILVREEYEVIAEIEKTTGTIPIVSKVYPCRFGLNFQDNHVIELGLYQHGLTNLPETMDSLKTLKYLDLSGNQLISIPESIGSLKSLTHLALSGNLLTSIPESIGSLKSLQYLDLSGNPLTSLPESISSLAALKVL